MLLKKEKAISAAERAALKSMSVDEFVAIDSPRLEDEIVSMRRRKLSKAKRYIGSNNNYLQERCRFPSFNPDQKEWECHSPYCVFCHARWINTLSQNLFINRLTCLGDEYGIDGSLPWDIAQYRFDPDAMNNFYITDTSELVRVALTVILNKKASAEMVIDSKYQHVASVFRFIALRPDPAAVESRSTYVLELCRLAFVPGGFTPLDEAADTIAKALRFPPTF